MRKLAIITGLGLAAAAVTALAGLVAAAFVDTGSAVVVAVVVALGLVVIGLIEWTHRGRRTLPVAATARTTDQGTRRSLDELRAARAHTATSPMVGAGHSAVSHALRSV
jgi:hypothetical protein